eukprot:1498275-Amphidinium_carterae.1
MEQGQDPNAVRMTTMLSAETFRVSIRTLQALHAGLIESVPNNRSLYKSHAVAKAEHGVVYEVGLLIGGTSIANK